MRSSHSGSYNASNQKVKEAPELFFENVKSQMLRAALDSSGERYSDQRIYIQKTQGQLDDDSSSQW